MRRAEFLKNFRKHLKKYKNRFGSFDMIDRLLNKECPLPIMPEEWTLLWDKQTQYYLKYRKNRKLNDQMISIVKKVCKI